MIALTFLTSDEAPLSAAIEQAFRAYRGERALSEADRLQMLRLVATAPEAFYRMYPPYRVTP